MTQRKQELTAAWLEKARRDLEAAERLISGENPLLDIGVFHCQQAAEKALKAWLTLREVIFPKTHSLVTLLSMCVETLPHSNQFGSHALELTPFATEFRYPGDVFEPTPDQAANALMLAEEIFNFCEQALKENSR